MLEAVLAEADYFISFETILLAAQESTPTLFRVSLYFSTNFYDKLVGENAWLGHLKAFNGTVMPAAEVVVDDDGWGGSLGSSSN